MPSEASRGVARRSPRARHNDARHSRPALTRAARSFHSSYIDGPNAGAYHFLPEIDIVETFWNCKGENQYQDNCAPPPLVRSDSR